MSFSTWIFTLDIYQPKLKKKKKKTKRKNISWYLNRDGVILPYTSLGFREKNFNQNWELNPGPLALLTSMRTIALPDSSTRIVLKSLFRLLMRWVLAQARFFLEPWHFSHSYFYEIIIFQLSSWTYIQHLAHIFMNIS